jgi:hypothetical protein
MKWNCFGTRRTSTSLITRAWLATDLTSPDTTDVRTYYIISDPSIFWPIWPPINRSLHWGVLNALFERKSLGPVFKRVVESIVKSRLAIEGVKENSDEDLSPVEVVWTPQKRLTLICIKVYLHEQWFVCRSVLRDAVRVRQLGSVLIRVARYMTSIPEKLYQIDTKCTKWS